MKKVLFAGMASVACSVLAVAGLGFLLAPLREAPVSSVAHVASLSCVPDDGVPRLFLVRKPHRDAWTRNPDRVVGSVFLRRSPGSDSVVALSSYHLSNRLRVGVVYDEERALFRSVCRKVLFSLDGELLEPERFRWVSDDMHRLSVRVEAGELFVDGASVEGGVQRRIREAGQLNGVVRR